MLSFLLLLVGCLFAASASAASADACGSAELIMDGVTPFDTTGSTPDGPVVIAGLAVSAGDIWFR